MAFPEQIPVTALVGSSNNLKDLKGEEGDGAAGQQGRPQQDERTEEKKKIVSTR